MPVIILGQIQNTYFQMTKIIASIKVIYYYTVLIGQRSTSTAVQNSQVYNSWTTGSAVQLIFNLSGSKSNFTICVQIFYAARFLNFAREIDSTISLLFKIESFDINPNIIALIRSYLSDRTFTWNMNIRQFF